MARNRFFTVFAYGKETTKGTPVNATRIRVGQAPRVVSDRKPQFIEEQFNVRMGSRRIKADYERLFMNTITTPEAGFQQLVMPFLTGLKGGLTPTEQTASQGDYLWTFTPNLTAAAGENTPDAITGYFYDDEKCWRVPYMLTSRITIKGSVAQDGGAAPVSLEQEMFGRYIKEQTLGGTPTLESSTPMNAKLTQLFLDSAWSGVGGTEVSDALVDFTVEILTGVHPKFRGSSSTLDSQSELKNYFNSHGEGIIAYNATFTLDTSQRDEEFASHQAGSLRVARLKINGPQIGSGENHSLTVDMGGGWESASPIDNEDRGDNLATYALHGIYDDTDAKGLQVALSTSQSTI